ncbi:MAG: DUF547 domain-containing protein [Proteobacteria bacterium]|nr:DUF547 domain-containing protein [Pseudomonadota bacterium]
MVSQIKKSTVFVTLILLMVQPVLSQPFDQQHAIWTELLKKHVVMKNENRISQVDYQAFKKDIAPLDTYLSGLSRITHAEFNGWSSDEKLSFLINAYNAFTVKLILDHYPVNSIRDIKTFFKGPWNIEFISLFGEIVSLDDIEHNMIRKKGAFDEPRIHMAVVCASIGCPALLDEAFTPDKLDKQLETNVERFLGDKSRNRFNPEKKTLEVSKIFKWYGSDFEMTFTSLERFFAHYATLFTTVVSEQDMIKRQAVKIEYLDYDWRLNDIN